MTDQTTMPLVPYSYLGDQFAEIAPIMDGIRELVKSTKFTLGPAVAEFEERFAALQGVPFAVGVASGTDALALALRAIGVGYRDEVITAPNTFIATVGAIVQVGARPVFVDVGPDYQIDPSKIDEAITGRTRALMPVHLGGTPADMPSILSIARARQLAVVEDAAQAINAAIDDTPVGRLGAAAGFSLHPLKNLNVWGDGGVVVTSSSELRDRLRLLRNHGLADRDRVETFGVNSRLDTLQALVGLFLIDQTVEITEARRRNARSYDTRLGDLEPYVTIPPRSDRRREVFHTYVVQVQRRDALYAYLRDRGVEAKIHYPVPVHLQPAARGLGYGPGDFPVTEAQAGRIISLPVHQHLTDEQVDHVADLVRRFYGA